MTWAALCADHASAAALPWPGAGVTEYGTRSDTVKAIQQRLIARGYLASGLDTGYYGPLTRAAVSRLQTELGFHGADADGIVGPASWRSLFTT